MTNEDIILATKYADEVEIITEHGLTAGEWRLAYHGYLAGKAKAEEELRCCGNCDHWNNQRAMCNLSMYGVNMCDKWEKGELNNGRIS